MVLDKRSLEKEWQELTKSPGHRFKRRIGELTMIALDYGYVSYVCPSLVYAKTPPSGLFPVGDGTLAKHLCLLAAFVAISGGPLKALVGPRAALRPSSAALHTRFLAALVGSASFATNLWPAAAYTAYIFSFCRYPTKQNCLEGVKQWRPALPILSALPAVL
jgi:hypothetical protein